MGIFDNHGSVNRTCPNDNLANPTQEAYSNGFTFHQLAMIVAGACTVFACLLSCFLIFKHATHYSVPKEQRQIIRVISIVPAFAIVSFLSVAFEDASIYLTFIANVFEAYSFTAFFMLLCQYISPDESARDAIYVQKGIISLVRRTSISVFQFPIMMIVLLAATDITEAAGIYCKTSDKVQFAHIWITILNAVSSTFAIMGVLRLYRATKAEIASRKPLLKLVCFKLIVGLNFFQGIIFSFLSSSKKLKPTNHITYNDLTEALPALILCVEMALISLLFLYAYRATEYRFNVGDRGNKVLGMGSGGYQGGVLGWRAIAQSWDIRDMFVAAGNILGTRERGQGYQHALSNDAIPLTSVNSQQYQNAPYEGEQQYQGAQYPHPGCQHYQEPQGRPVRY